jgi:hypothetical protein
LPRGSPGHQEPCRLLPVSPHDQEPEDPAQPLNGSGGLMPPYGERATFGHLEGLERPVANDEAMVHTGNGGLVWVLVKAAVQPDRELPGQALRSSGVGAVVAVTMLRATWVATSGTTNAHPPPTVHATPIAAFMNSASAIAVSTAA